MKIIILNLCCLITLGVKAQDLPTYLEAITFNENEPTQTMFYEDFKKSNMNNWVLGETRLSYAGLDWQGFVYQSYNPKDDKGKWPYNILSNLPVDLNHDYIILMDMEHKRSIGPTAYYFVWGQDMGTRHAMGVNSGKFTYQFCDDNKFASPVITERNMNYEAVTWRFKIQKKKDSIYFYQSNTPYLVVPYKKFTAANNSILPTGMIGFLLNGEVKIRCFNIQVLQNMAYGAKADSAYYLSYLAKANTGDVNAIFQLGNMCWQGKGTNTDKNKALKLYKQAAGLGHLRATLNTGWIYEQQYKQSQKQLDRDSAIAYYRTASIKNTGEPYDYFYRYMQIAYPYVELFDYRYYTLQKPPPAESEYLAEKKRYKEMVDRTAADAHFKMLPDYLVELISIDKYRPEASYISAGGKTRLLIKVTPITLQHKDFYYDEAERQFFLYENGVQLSKWAKTQSDLYVVRGGCRSVNLLWEEKTCRTCNGKGFTGGGMGSQTVYIPTGTYTTTRSQTIVGQTELVTVTPNYATSKVNIYIPPVSCNVCGGAGKSAKQCFTIIKIQ